MSTIKHAKLSHVQLATILEPWSTVDDDDWGYLFSWIPESGHGQFWKSVLIAHRIAIGKATGAQS